jgi:hypothetical protein
MRHSLRTFAGWSVVLVLTAGLVVQACQDQAGMTTAPDLASVATVSLNVTGGGTGTGTVTAPLTAGVPAMICSITAGSYDPIECTRNYPQNTRVILTATPAPGSSFTEWQGACQGTSPICSKMMNKNKSVRAVFTSSIVPSFAVNVTGAGSGNGTVTSQTGLTPAIACTITNGTPTGACSQTYLLGTTVVLTATAASNHTFDNWSGDCTGTGTCSLSVTANRSVTANFSQPLGAEATFGKWDAPVSTPIVALHLSLLPDGRALMFGHMGEPYVWNPSGGYLQVSNATCTNNTVCELFCAGHTYLADGRLLVAGGHNEALGNNNGIRQASIFDGTTWQNVDSMDYQRWYPTLVTLETGDVVALSGNQAPGVKATIPERFNGSTWTPLTTANQSLPLYPRAFVEPKQGHIFMAGDYTVRFLNPAGTGAWRNGPQRAVSERPYGSAVMLDSKVLIGGGGGEVCPNPVQKSTEIIDLAAATPAWSSAGDMKFARRQTNFTILPDGKVLVTGGTSACGFSNESGAVFKAEMWDPATRIWTEMAGAANLRVYHSTTMLLPDGRVMSAGSGDGGGPTQQFNYELYSPPYLFKGPRPSYTLAGSAIHYNTPFTVTSSDAASIRKVTIIRLASTTHSFDESARLNTLSFQAAADGQSLTITPPASGRIAPPGPYLLFILNVNGVPSVAQTVMLGQ